MVDNTYRSRLYDSYVTTHLTDEPPLSVRELERLAPVYRARLRRFLPPTKDLSVLDIGCGAGRVVWYLQREGYRDVRGVDISPEQVQLARSLGIDNVVHGDAREYLAQHARTFDLITAFDVFEHMTKPEVLSMLDAARDALRVGGHLLVQTTNGAGPFSGYYFYGDFTHQTAFTARSMSQLLRNARFDQIAILEAEPIAHGARSTLRRFVWRIVRAALIAYLAAETGVIRGHVLTQNLIAFARRPD